MDAPEARGIPRYRRAASVEAAPMQQETILFDSASNKFCLLNSSAAMVWNHLEAPADAGALAAALCAAFEGVSPDQALRDVEAALEEFRALALVELAT
ncbi:MAG: PqqD family protein [Gemmatimonadetes bacterium]|nr:PqqD family protein [Gemmatimonadota bacterium]